MSPKKNVTWDLTNEVRENEVMLKMEEIINDDNEEDDDANIFKLLKRVPIVKSETSVKSETTVKSETSVKSETTNDNKIAILQNDVKLLNNKIDLILELLKNKN